MDLALNNLQRLICHKTQQTKQPTETRGYLHDVMVKAMDCGIVISEFELQSRYYVHFRTNAHGKGMNPLILPVMS